MIGTKRASEEISGFENYSSRDFEEDEDIIDSQLHTSELTAKELQQLSAKERRRERNKLLARKSRLKLKSDVEELKGKLFYLAKENEVLKSQLRKMVAPPLPAKTLINSEFQLPDHIMQLVQQLITRTEAAMNSRKIKASSYCISNAISPDFPLVYASSGFLKLTGYEMHEIMGRNCRFLQGPRTDRQEVLRMKQALLEGRDSVNILLNYTKEGKPFWNQVSLSHLKDRTGRTFLVVGIQTKLKPATMINKTIAQSQETHSSSLLPEIFNTDLDEQTTTTCNNNNYVANNFNYQHYSRDLSNYFTTPNTVATQIVLDVPATNKFYNRNDINTNNFAQIDHTHYEMNDCNREVEMLASYDRGVMQGHYDHAFNTNSKGSINSRCTEQYDTARMNMQYQKKSVKNECSEQDHDQDQDFLQLIPDIFEGIELP